MYCHLTFANLHSRFLKVATEPFPEKMIIKINKIETEVEGKKLELSYMGRELSPIYVIDYSYS